MARGLRRLCVTTSASVPLTFSIWAEKPVIAFDDFGSRFSAYSRRLLRRVAIRVRGIAAHERIANSPALNLAKRQLSIGRSVIMRLVLPFCPTT